MSIQLDRKLVLTYCKMHALVGVAAFLERVITPEGFSDFALYVRTNGGISTEVIQSKFLLHGSLKPLDFLTSSKNTKEKSIYATDNANYAIFLAVIDIQESGGASVHVSKSEFSITTGFVNGTSKISDGFVHIVPRNGFKETSNTEYVCENTVPVMFSVPVFFEDLTEKVFVKN